MISVKNIENGLRVLDNGLVLMEDFMGSEATILDCARISKSDAKVNGELVDRDLKLLKFLFDNGHHTPFEHCVLRFRIKAPIFVMRQWMRHRIGTFNEYSMRYREPIKEYYTPEDLSSEKKDKYHRILKKCIKFVCKNVEKNQRDRELLRNILPVAMYTEVIWTVNLRALLNFLKLRGAQDAQYEIKLYAKTIANMARIIYPNVMRLFEEKEEINDNSTK